MKRKREKWHDHPLTRSQIKRICFLAEGCLQVGLQFSNGVIAKFITVREFPRGLGFHAYTLTRRGAVDHERITYLPGVSKDTDACLIATAEMALYGPLLPLDTPN